METVKDLKAAMQEDAYTGELSSILSTSSKAKHTHPASPTKAAVKKKREGGGPLAVTLLLCLLFCIGWLT